MEMRLSLCGPLCSVAPLVVTYGKGRTGCNLSPSSPQASCSVEAISPAVLHPPDGAKNIMPIYGRAKNIMTIYGRAFPRKSSSAGWEVQEWRLQSQIPAFGAY